MDLVKESIDLAYKSTMDRIRSVRLSYKNKEIRSLSKYYIKQAPINKTFAFRAFGIRRFFQLDGGAALPPICSN